MMENQFYSQRMPFPETNCKQQTEDPIQGLTRGHNKKQLVSKVGASDKLLTYTYCGKGWAYDKALFFQQNKIVSKNEVCVLAGEHEPVFTLGNSLKNFDSKHLAGVPFVQTDRGGKVMYHGPGQLTLYFIFNLEDYFKGPKEYVGHLFLQLIEFFAKEHGIRLTCKKQGLWFEDKKVGFVGLRIKEKKVYHGVSLNYQVDLGAFLTQSPCDIKGSDAGNLFKNSSCNLELEAKKIVSYILQAKPFHFSVGL